MMVADLILIFLGSLVIGQAIGSMLTVLSR
jgi:hypothetical protein